MTGTKAKSKKDSENEQNKDTVKKENIHKNHRERILKRYFKFRDSIEPHELLEILLFGKYRQKNTNLIAHKLMHRYESIENVFKAPRDELLTFDGVGKSVSEYLNNIDIIRQKYFKYLESRYTVKLSEDNILEFIKENLMDNRNTVSFLMITKDNYLISIRTLPVDNRLFRVDFTFFISSAYQDCADRIIIVHNTSDGYMYDRRDKNKINDVIDILLLSDIYLLDYLILYDGKCMRIADYEKYIKSEKRV